MPEADPPRNWRRRPSRRWLVGGAALLAIAASIALLRGLAGDEPRLDGESLREDALAPKATPGEFDVTVVVFSDYRCPHCRTLHRTLQTVAAADGRIRIVYRDWPVFGAPSAAAARLAIASQWQGTHAAFHDALMRAEGPLDEPALRRAAAAADIDWERLQADVAARRGEIDGLIARSAAFAAAFGFHGTPGLVIGRYVIPGGLGPADLRRAVAMARE